MDDVRITLAEMLGNAVEQLHTIYAPEEQVRQMENLIKQLDENCVVAIVGRVKAGKSTFINALLGDDLAPVGVTETTAAITYFCWGQADNPDFPVRCKWRNSSLLEPQNRAFLKSLQGNDIETLRRSEQIDYLEYVLDHPFLQQVTLVDTPGIGSALDQHQDVTARYMDLTGQLRVRHEQETRQIDSSADAVIYLIGNTPRAEDRDVLDEFATLTGGKSLATNAIGVMAKIDVYDDFPDGPSARAAKYAAQLKDQLNTIMPVSAGLQRALDQLRVNDWAGLVRIMETLRCIKSEYLEELLRGSELYLMDRNLIEGDVSADWDFILKSPVSVTERKELLGDFDWMVFKAIVTEAKAADWDLHTTVVRLTTLAGFEPLRSLLKQRFFERGQLIRCYRILNDALKIVGELRFKFLSTLHEKNIEEKARLTRFLAFLQQMSSNPDEEDVRRELVDFVIAHTTTTKNIEQVEGVLMQVQRDLSKLRHIWEAVPKDLEALHLLDNHAHLFSDPQELEELRTLFGRNGIGTKHRLRPEQMNTAYIHSRAQFWRSINSREKPPLSVIAKCAELSYERLLYEIEI